MVNHDSGDYFAALGFIKIPPEDNQTLEKLRSRAPPRLRSLRLCSGQAGHVILAPRFAAGKSYVEPPTGFARLRPPVTLGTTPRHPFLLLRTSIFRRRNPGVAPRTVRSRMEPPMGFEPTTLGLRYRCSTTELGRLTVRCCR